MASQRESCLSMENSSEADFDNACAICRKSGKHVEATKTCLDCRQTLCDGCLNDHDKFDITKGHRIVGKAMTVKDQVALPSQMCEKHLGKLIDMFCPQHDVVCCTGCIALHHRLCDDVKYVPSISAGTKSSEHLQDVIQVSKDTLNELNKRKKEREEDKNRLSIEKSNADESAQESARKIIELVNYLKQKSLFQIQRKFDEFQQKVEKDLKKVNSAIASLGKDIEKLEKASDDNESQLFITMKQSKEHGRLGASLNIEMESKVKREALHFNVYHEVENYIKKVDTLGELETPFFSFAEIGQYNIRLKKDKEKCSIRGICLMSDGNILVIDRDNEKLKRLDSNYSPVDHCKLPGRPLSICRAEPNEVAIALGRQQMVQFVSVTDTLTPTRSFHVGEICRGIAYSRGQIFVTSGGSKKEGPGEVAVFTLDGKLQHKLPRKSSGQPVWACPYRIDLSPDGKHVMVTDSASGVVVMDANGAIVRKHPLDAGGLCLQHHSLWFVSGNNSNSVYQVNSDGSNLGPLLTEKDGVNHRLVSVCYQRYGNTLILGFLTCDYIKVFKLFKK